MAHTDRLHSLDGLRAVAALLVITHHLGTSAVAEALGDAGHEVLSRMLSGLTASGVELFFVLSAIVLTGPYVRRERALDVGRYASRRVQRLMPPYLAAWLLAGITIYIASAHPTWWTLGAALPDFSLQSWIAQIGIIYFGHDAFNFAWWSLSVEVCFYVLAPILVVVFIPLRSSRTKLGLAFLAAVLVSVATTFRAPPALASVPVAFNLLAYASCFCAGLVLACQRVPLVASRCLIGLGGIWVCTAGFQPQFNAHVGWGMVYFGVVAIAMERGSRLSKWLSTYRFVWLGERSYSLFLVHYSVIGLVCHAVSASIDHKSALYFALTRALSIPLSLAMAILVFHLVERKFAHNLVTANDLLPSRSGALKFGATALQPLAERRPKAVNVQMSSK